jgi:DNA-directed RNA polymerase subunit RPC12/RpoP
MQDHEIKCPTCGCTPEEGFDVVQEHAEPGDDQIWNIYLCPKCNKKYIRAYHFSGWGSM